MTECRTQRCYGEAASKVNDAVAGAVQDLFDAAQLPILDRIAQNLAELERRGAKLPRIDGLPARQGQASKIGDAIADMVRDARETKAAEKDTLTATGYP